MAAKPTPYRRADGSISWKVRFRVTPGTAPTSETFTTQAAAERFARLVDEVGGQAARDARNASDTSGANVPTLLTWFDHHLELLAADTTPGTRADYRRMADRTWMPRLGRLPIDAITKDAVTQWVAWQRKQPSRSGGTYSPKSIRNAHGLLSSVLQSAMEAEIVPRNVAKGVGLPSDATDAEMEIFTRDEWDRFIAAMDPWYRPLTWFLLTTGCRIGEATALQVRDLDLTAREASVRIRRAWKKDAQGSYLGSPKTRRSNRTVLIHAALADELRELTRGRKSDALVFTTPLPEQAPPIRPCDNCGRMTRPSNVRAAHAPGTVPRQTQGLCGRCAYTVDIPPVKPPRLTASDTRILPQHYRNRHWAQALTAAGITKHLTPHSLRHTSASWLLTAGESPMVVQHRLGHESLNTTSRVYAHLLTDAQVGAAATMAALTSPPRQLEP